MNKKFKEKYIAMAQQAGFVFDEESETVSGHYNDYNIVVFCQNANVPGMISLRVSAVRPDGEITKEEKQQLKSENKQISGIFQNGSNVIINMKNSNDLQSIIIPALDTFTNFLKMSGFTNCCQMCGKTVDTESYYVSGGVLNICPDCSTSVQQNKTLNNTKTKHKKENVVGGIVGALLGSLIGVLCIVLLGQLGYVAAISGVMMAVCTIKGYELLGGKISTKGIIISCIIMILMTYIGDRVDWAVVICREYETSRFFAAFNAVPYFISEGAIEIGGYIGNLLLLYVFVIIGALPTIIASFKNNKVADKMYKITGRDNDYHTPEM